MNKTFTLAISFFFLIICPNIVLAQTIGDQKVLYSSSPIDRARYVVDGYNEYCEGYPTGTKGYCNRYEMRTRYASTQSSARFSPSYSQSFGEFRGVDLAQYGGGYGIFGVAYPDGQDNINSNPNYYNKWYSNSGYSMIKLTNWSDKSVPFVDIQSGSAISSPLVNFTLATNGGAKANLLNLRVGKGNDSEALSIWNETERPSISIKSSTGKLTELKNDSLFVDGVDKITLHIREVTSNYTLVTADDIVIVRCDNCIVTLPKINFVKKFIIKKMSAQLTSVKIVVAENGKIDDAYTIETKTKGRALEFTSDGNNNYYVTN